MDSSVHLACFLTVVVGDTVNTASRIESTGEGNRVHMSSETASLLIAAGKGHWLEKRKDKVFAKGKGEMETYWLKSVVASGGSESHDDNTDFTVDPDCTDTGGDGFQGAFRTDASKLNRLIRFNVGTFCCCSFRGKFLVNIVFASQTEILSGFLKQILARRETCGSMGVGKGLVPTLRCEHETPFKEVKEIVVLPELNRSVAVNQVDVNSFDLPIKVSQELHLYIRQIAELYNSNPCTYIKRPVLMQILKFLSSPTLLQQFITLNTQGPLVVLRLFTTSSHLFLPLQSRYFIGCEAAFSHCSPERYGL
jgi:Adenylate and Guanylate cyclase catalytic domain